MLLRAERAAQRLTLRQLAAKSGLSVMFLSDIEHDKRTAREESWRKIAYALGSDPKPFLRALARWRIARLREEIAQLQESVR